MTPPCIDKAVSAKPVRTKRRKEERSRHQRNRESTANRVERISALCRGQRKRKRNRGQERERLKTHGLWGLLQMYLIFIAWAPRSRMQTARSYQKKTSPCFSSPYIELPCSFQHNSCNDER